MASLRDMQWWADTLKYSAANAGWLWYDGYVHQIALWAAEKDLGKDDFSEALLRSMDQPVTEDQAYRWRISVRAVGLRDLREVVEQLKLGLGVPLQRWPFEEQ